VVERKAAPVDVGQLWVTERQRPDLTAPRSRDRRGGTYRRYFPAPLDERMSPLVDSDAAEAIADASATVGAVAQRLRDRPVPMLYSTLLRSESISSSWIEGLRETPRNVVVAQLRGRDPGLSGYQFDHLDTADAILGNLASVRAGVESLREPWTDRSIHAIHRTIAPATHRGGYREVDVQIGGGSKLTASYVAPPAELVPGLMANLLGYANHSPDNPLVKAAILHAQFETIHPYEDGNGRTGRVLVHGYLARAKVLDHGVLPLSIVLRRDTDEYVRRLTAFRHAEPGERPEAVSQFVGYFADVLADACDETARVIDESEDVAADWEERTAGFRAGSAARRTLDVLSEQPVVTARFLAASLGVSPPTAHSALGHLVEVGVLEPAGGRFKRSEVFQAPSLLRMMDRLVPGIQPTALPRARPAP